MSLRNQYALAASRTFGASLVLFCASLATAQSDGHKWSAPQRSAEPRQFEADPAARSAQGPIALLIRNADMTGGKPPFALVDQFGKVQRYVEPSPGIDLTAHVGSRVRVLHDTGETLLASQLDLPVSLPSDLQPLVQNRSLKRQTEPKNQNQIHRDFDHEQGIIAVQFDEGITPLSDNAEPIVLEELLSSEAGHLPGPSSRHSTETLAPIVGEEILPHGSHSHPHSSDCPHCNKQHSSAPIQVESTTCDCDRCRVKPASSYRKTSHRDHAWSGCPNCGRGDQWCGPTCNPGSRRGWYGRADYLLWWFKGMDTPPLVTGGTQASEGVLGRPGTTVLFGGNNDLFDDARSGLRLSLGMWLDDERNFAIEGDWLFMETESIGFSAGDPTGATIISRPFYNLTPMDGGGNLLGPAEDAELVSFPNTVGGTVSVRARSKFKTGGIRLRTGLCCRELGCGSGCGATCGSTCGDACGGCGSGVGEYGGGKSSGIARIDFITGYRYASLEESLTIQENLTSLLTAAPGQFVIRDQFETDNEFHGLDLGFIAEWETRRWGLELTSKIALGNTQQRVRINGSTTTSNNGTSVTDTGGLLALNSNIGSYSQDRFSVLPELSARLNYRLTPRVRLSAGYTLLYWANVVRPGDQIDLNVDTRLLPPTTVTGSRPAFAFHETSLWAHGLNFGIDCNY